MMRSNYHTTLLHFIATFTAHIITRQSETLTTGAEKGVCCVGAILSTSSIIDQAFIVNSFTHTHQKEEKIVKSLQYP